MNDKVNLLDIRFKDLNLEEKRAALVIMDVSMKRLHQHGLMVTDFNPSQIYYENGLYFFKKVSPISDYYIDNKEKAVFRNVLGLSNLAFCSYLPEYNLNNGLLSYDVIHQQFQNFSNYFPKEDVDYYKNIFIDSYNDRKLLGNVVYFSDYVIKQKNDVSNNKASSLAYIKATEVGRAFARQEENEAAFGSKFFILAIVTAFTIFLIGLLFFLYAYFI